jgi:hypothetical protein
MKLIVFGATVKFRLKFKKQKQLINFFLINFRETAALKL